MKAAVTLKEDVIFDVKSSIRMAHSKASDWKLIFEAGLKREHYILIVGWIMLSLGFQCAVLAYVKQELLAGFLSLLFIAVPALTIYLILWHVANEWLKSNKIEPPSRWYFGWQSERYCNFRMEEFYRHLVYKKILHGDQHDRIILVDLEAVFKKDAKDTITKGSGLAVGTILGLVGQQLLEHFFKNYLTISEVKNGESSLGTAAADINKIFPYVTWSGIITISILTVIAILMYRLYLKLNVPHSSTIANDLHSIYLSLKGFYKDS